MTKQYLSGLAAVLIALLIIAPSVAVAEIKLQDNVQEVNDKDKVIPVDKVADCKGTYVEGYIYGTAHVNTIKITKLVSFPAKVKVLAQGYLPDSCTVINEVKTRKEGNCFYITISTKRPAGAICAMVLKNFSETILLDVQGLKSGKYTVDVNGVKGTFVLP